MEPLEQSGRGPFTHWPMEGKGGDPQLDNVGAPNPSTSACRVGRADLGRVWRSRRLGGGWRRSSRPTGGGRLRPAAMLGPTAGKGGMVAGV